MIADSTASWAGVSAVYSRGCVPKHTHNARDRDNMDRSILPRVCSAFLQGDGKVDDSRTCIDVLPKWVALGDLATP